MWRFGLLAGLAWLAGCAEPAREGVLAVCLREADPPRSTVGEGGFDVDVAQLLADQLNRRLKMVWLPEPQRTEIESSDLTFGPLLNGRCNLMLSIPGADALSGFEKRLSLSQPYYGTSFELIPADGRLTEGVKVAVQANTVAHVVIDAQGYDWTMQPDTRAIVAAVADGHADVGLAWGPELALTGARWNPGFEPPELLRWNQHALVRSDDQMLLAQVNVALAALRARILELLADHGMPARPPWATTHRAAALRAL